MKHSELKACTDCGQVMEHDLCPDRCDLYLSKGGRAGLSMPAELSKRGEYLPMAVRPMTIAELTVPH